MTLSKLRQEMDGLNRDLLLLIAKRTQIAREIARIKKRENLPILDEERERLIQEEVKKTARTLGLSVAVMAELFDLLLNYTRLEMEISQ